MKTKRQGSKMKRVLFQGDSITDACRLRNEADGFNMGYGYAMIAAANLGSEYPGEFEFFNKANGGNKITDLYARMKRDIFALKPDYMSLMIGVNDVWHEKNNDGTTAERFEQIYRCIIEDTLNELPDIKIMLMTPFHNCITEKIFDNFNEEVSVRANIVKKLADEYGLALMDTQAVIDEIQKIAPMEFWAADGVHPTIFGHKKIADKWLETFKTICE